MAKATSEWLVLAKNDLESAKILLDSKKHVAGVSIYLAHQSVEKSLKYLLSNKIKTIPKIHNLMNLMTDVINYTDCLNDKLAEIQKLDQYFPKLRYPTGDRFNKDDAFFCYKTAKMIFDIVIKNEND